MNKHENTKKKLKIISVALLSIGTLLITIELIDFFVSAGSMTMPSLFFLFFIGIPLIGVGSSLTNLGFKKEMMRYHKDESVPIINEASEEISPAIKNVINSIRNPESQIICSCGYSNSSDSLFCKKCGKALHIVCHNCGKKLDNDSEYCSYCGTKIS